MPAFPCDGIIFVHARDGLLYAVPEGMTGIKTDRVHEVHGGRIVCSHDNHGIFTYADVVSHTQSEWSEGSNVSEITTASLSGDESEFFPFLTSLESQVT